MTRTEAKMNFAAAIARTSDADQVALLELAREYFTNKISRIGRAMYGPSWRNPLAQALGISRRTLHRYETGASPLPADMMERLNRLAERQVAELRALIY